MKRLLHMLKAGKVVRYHTIPNPIRHQSVAEHVYNIHHLVHWMLDGVVNDNVMQLIMMHDAEEYHTGDVPHPAKQRNSELREHLNQLEREVFSDLGVKLRFTADEYRLVKWADMCEMGIYASHHLYLSEYRLVLRNVSIWLQNNDYPPNERAAQLGAMVRQAHLKQTPVGAYDD